MVRISCSSDAGAFVMPYCCGSSHHIQVWIVSILHIPQLLDSPFNTPHIENKNAIFRMLKA
jgi:hypothetical protein